LTRQETLETLQVTHLYRLIPETLTEVLLKTGSCWQYSKLNILSYL
jgi:hypothetical protein